MYESFYDFHKKPFSLASDADFLFLGSTHSTAFAMLEFGVLSQAGFTVITGEVGCGKTTLIHHLLKQLADTVKVGLITNTRKNMGELLPWVLHAFELDYREEHNVALYDNFSKFLTEQYEKKQRTVLIFDEAQNLDEAVLDELRMLSNLNAADGQFLQIILVGQPELRQTLSRSTLMQFSQRIAADYHITTLSEDETINYTKHRIRAAGSPHDIFTPNAFRLIHVATNGVPRLINILCDTILSYAFGEEILLINEDYVRDVLAERAEGGLLALGQAPLKALDSAAHENQNLSELVSSTVTAETT